MIFKNFPDDPNLYSEDMRHIVSKTIERHGIEEWRAGVLTNELHGHLGIYAIIGVKMGVFALESIGAEAGDVHIISFAGIEPPVSCMNDGLQVSTRATLGHGLIKSEPTDTPRSEAIFITTGKMLQIKVNDAISNMITKEIAEAVNRWGYADEYWAYVRKLAIDYWYELDRKNIFDIKNI
ncbi:MAG: formylmethanofuran dehydrogenase subunit E family protein [Prevotella sp.]|jgi:pyrimidine-specific ribonucleoside hydrolase|nr:formylmethanofuran dehydrogenase subunit E family protein [Prevotella sp.]